MIALVAAVRTHVAALVAAVPTRGCAGGGSTYPCGCPDGGCTPVAAPVVAVPLWLRRWWLYLPVWLCQWWLYLPLWLCRWWLYPCGCAGGGSTPVIALVAAVRTPVVAPVPVDVVAQLDAHLPLSRLVADVRVTQKLLRVWPVAVVLQQTRLDKTHKLTRPANATPQREVRLKLNRKWQLYV